MDFSYFAKITKSARILQHLKNLLVITGCIKCDFMYKALQSLSRKYVKCSCFSIVLLYFNIVLVANELLPAHCG